MKGSIVIIAVFAAGCIAGITEAVTPGLFGDWGKDIPEYLLYALMFLVGTGLGANKDTAGIIKGASAKLLILPAASICGTLAFTALAGMLLHSPDREIQDYLAVGSGMGYYSLSSVLITKYKEVSIGLQAASELGAVALLTNIFRELFTLAAVPALAKKISPFAPVASAGVTAIDVSLPVILKYSGQGMLAAALISGIVTEISVPLLVTLFCSI